MASNDELIQELKSARLAVHKAAEARDEARFLFLEKKAAYGKAMGVVEEILLEIETGKTGRPLLDAANGAATAGPAKKADRPSRPKKPPTG